MKMKKILGYLLALALIISLSACGKDTVAEGGADSPAPKKNGLEQNREELAGQAVEEPVQESLEEKLADTYWTAYELNDGFGVEELPADYKWMDLILRSDGTAQFREVQYDLILNNDLMLHMTWKIQGDRIGLYVEGFEDPYCEGTVDEEGMVLEYYGYDLYLKQSPMPKEAGELLSPAQLAGTWVLSSGEAEGWEWDAREEREYGILHITSYWDEDRSALALAANYEDRTGWADLRGAFYDRELTLLEEPLYEGCGNERWSVRLGPESPLNEHGYPEETDYYVTLVDENTLLLQKYFTIDNGPGVSYSCFKRILPTVSVWELEMEELMGADWEAVSFTDAEGKEHDTVPGMEDLFIHLDGMGYGFVSWTDEATGETVSSNGQWLLGTGGGILIYEGEREEAWFSGAVMMQGIETMEESIYRYEMYLYYDGGIIRLHHIEGSGGEDFDAESAADGFGDRMLYLEQMAYSAPEEALLVLYGDEFLEMDEYEDLPHYQYSKNGVNSHELLITALYDNTEIYMVDEDGSETLIASLNAYESMVLLVDIPKSTEQYLGFWADGESFVYDINQDYINVKDWTYLTR